jgi:hypothetical protein
MKRYNPYMAALAAAATELASDRAQGYYSIRAQQDIQSAFEAVLTLGCWVYQLAVMTYELGRAASNQRRASSTPTLALCQLDNALSCPSPSPKRPLALAPASAPIALLPACIEPALQPMPTTAIKTAPAAPIGKLPAHALNKAELIIQIQSRSPRKVPGIWKMKREALDELYATI